MRRSTNMNINLLTHYLLKRWPHLSQRHIRNTIRTVTKHEESSTFYRTDEQRNIDICLRVTQLYEADDSYDSDDSDDSDEVSDSTATR